MGKWLTKLGARYALRNVKNQGFKDLIMKGIDSGDVKKYILDDLRDGSLRKYIVDGINKGVDLPLLNEEEELKIINIIYESLESKVDEYL